MACTSSNVIFQNPECKSLESVQLSIPNDGINLTVPALSKYFVEDRYFLHYKVPDFYSKDGDEILGAKDDWIEVTTFVINDLMWLRGLPYYKFWSNVIYNSKIKEFLTTFLQNAPSSYNLDLLPKDKDVNELVNQLFQNVLIIYARLVTNSESPTEFMTKEVQGKLLYDNYIFTIPVIFDICQHYGRENKKVVKKLLKSIFTLQPLYINDAKEAILYILQIFQSIEQRFEDSPIPLAGEAIKLKDHKGEILQMELPALEDVAFHVLDTVSTVGLFVENYPPSIPLFKENEFLTKLVSMYSNAIPKMYKQLNTLTKNSDTSEGCTRVKRLLDTTRIECLQFFRTVIYKDIIDILETTSPIPEEETFDRVDIFLNLLFSALSEEEFMVDYIRLYPFDVDIDILTHICPNLPKEKIDYINQITSNLSSDSADNLKNKSEQNNAKYNCNQSKSDAKDNETISEKQLSSCVSAVKDVLCDLDDDLIIKCLRYYNYDSEAVIDAILENALPQEIEDENSQLPELHELSKLKINEADINSIQNVNHETDLCNIITNLNDHRNKNDTEDFQEILDDKLHIKQSKAIYDKYAYVIDEYEDEYDDQYIGNDVQDDTVEVDKPFTTPRILMNSQSKYENVEEDSDESDEEVVNTTNHFLQDPAKIRAEKARFSKNFRGESSSQKENSKGKEHDKTDKKNKNPNFHTVNKKNHNRRAGSSWKKRQGMIPI